MQVGPIGNTFSVTFWVDKPAKQARSQESGDARGIVRTSSEDLKANEADVPLYDRVTPSLSSQEANKDGCVELEREAVRCFNCGSYSHALRECKRQWNYEAINSARSNHAAKRTFSSGPRSVARYYEAQHSNENQEPDRSPWQLLQTGEHGLSPSNSGKEPSRNTPGLLKKPEKNNKLASNDENEEGEIVDGVVSPCDEEELFIAFSPDPPSQADRSPDFSGVRVPFNSPPGGMWRSPPAYSPPSQLHPNFHHQRPFAYSPPNHVYPHTPSPVHYNGVHAQRSWDERQPQRAWDERQPQRAWEERSPYYPENSVSPAVNVPSAPIPTVNVPSAPIPIPAAKKEDDDWELNFESSVHQSECSRSHTGVPVVTDHYTPTAIRHQSLTLNTTSAGYSPPDPSQLSPTGSGYGESFRPSPVPQTSVQYHFSYHTTPGREPTSYSTEAWEKAQAALSSLQSDGQGGGS
ncbi:hypothetical protein M758_3G206400 [Ceratodon purpureus]|nr:hypothetical protein KC19_3G206700 [Ceratodon purpureus]KAG0623843.1 hypothetical protein M758_3G206400 [Ceratodon purpureus]